MNGTIIPGTNIAVDFWKIREQPTSGLTFFLTHLHGDHIVGLTSSWCYPIYCTEVTATLLQRRYDLDPAILCPLEVNESHLITTNEKTQTTITVTVIDANHCPGAAMFLFEGDFGKILHTGDFRYHPDMFSPDSCLSSHIGSVDVVYLDNTFCSPECVFPSRIDSKQEILRIIQNHPEHQILIGMRKLGKEELLQYLAEELQEWISVNGEQFKVAEILGLPKVFQVQDSSCRIRTIPFGMISKRNMLKYNQSSPTIAILPTAIYVGIGGQPFVNQENVFVVPYSDHSSFTELKEFVSKLRPSSIVPVVSGDSKGPFNISLKSRADMSIFSQFCTEQNLRTRLRERTQNHCILSSHKSKPKLKKSKSGSLLVRKKPVEKGVNFQSCDSEQGTPTKAKTMPIGDAHQHKSELEMHKADGENNENIKSDHKKRNTYLGEFQSFLDDSGNSSSHSEVDLVSQTPMNGTLLDNHVNMVNEHCSQGYETRHVSGPYLSKMSEHTQIKDKNKQVDSTDLETCSEPSAENNEIVNQNENMNELDFGTQGFETRHVSGPLHSNVTVEPQPFSETSSENTEMVDVCHLSSSVKEVKADTQAMPHHKKVMATRQDAKMSISKVGENQNSVSANLNPLNGQHENSSSGLESEDVDMTIQTHYDYCTSPDIFTSKESNLIKHYFVCNLQDQNDGEIYENSIGSESLSSEEDHNKSTQNLESDNNQNQRDDTKHQQAKQMGGSSNRNRKKPKSKLNTSKYFSPRKVDGAQVSPNQTKLKQFFNKCQITGKQSSKANNDLKTAKRRNKSLPYESNKLISSCSKSNKTSKRKHSLEDFDSFTVSSYEGDGRKRRKCGEFVGKKTWIPFSVKPLSKLTNVERKKSLLNTISMLQNVLEGHKD